MAHENRKVQISTGRYYSAQGQRVVIVVDPTARALYFNDVDRNIAGQIIGLNCANRWIEDDNEVARVVMFLYDVGAYEQYPRVPGEDGLDLDPNLPIKGVLL